MFTLCLCVSVYVQHMYVHQCLISFFFHHPKKMEVHVLFGGGSQFHLNIPVAYFPHRINILFLSSQFDVIHIHDVRISNPNWKLSPTRTSKRIFSNCLSHNSSAVKTTLQMTRFRDAKVCNNWLQIRIDDHRIQSDFKYKSELQNPEGKKSVLGIASAWCNRARHQWQRDHQDPEHIQHSAHEHWHVSAQFSCLLVRFVSSWFTHCTAWLNGVAHVISSMHEVCGSPSTLISILFYFHIFPFILYLLHFLLHSFHYLAGRSEPVHSAKQGMDSLDDSDFLKGMSPTLTTSRRLTSSPTQSPRSHHSSPSKGSSRTQSTMTPHSRVLLESERGNLLDQQVRRKMLQMHRLELCWTDRKSKFSPNVRRKLRKTNSRLIMTEEAYEN